MKYTQKNIELYINLNFTQICPLLRALNKHIEKYTKLRREKNNEKYTKPVIKFTIL